MEDKEPSYWVRWAAGIVAVVVAGVLVALLPAVFMDGPRDDPPSPASTPTPTPTPAVRITQFSLASRSAGEYPEATFKVYNSGGDTADRCVLNWRPLDSNVYFGDTFGTESSDEFAVEPGQTHTETLDGSTAYSPGSVTSGATVACSNSASALETKERFVLPDLSAP